MADRLHSAALHLMRRLRRVDSASGLGPSQLSVLAVLAFGGPRTPGQLAEAEQVTAPTMSRLVSSMEQEGLVRRRRDRTDGRRVWMEATPRGRALIVRGRQRRVELLARALAASTADDLAVLARAAELMERLSLTDSRA